MKLYNYNILVYHIFLRRRMSFTIEIFRITIIKIILLNYIKYINNYLIIKYKLKKKIFNKKLNNIIINPVQCQKLIVNYNKINIVIKIYKITIKIIQ
jgi:hypothetical protein